MKMRLKNDTGLSVDTTVVDELNNIVGGVCAIRLDPITGEGGGSIITGELSFEFGGGLDVELEPYVTRETLEKLAEQRGMRVVQEKQLTAAEALYGFAAWLTTRPVKTTMGADQDAAGVAELVDMFAKINELPEPRDAWQMNLTMPGRE